MLLATAPWWHLERTRPTGAWYQAGAIDRLVVVAAIVAMVAWAPLLRVGAWPPEAAAALLLGLPGIPLLVARATGRAPGRPPLERWAARALVAWLVVGLVSALSSATPALSIVGLFGQGTGWLFMVVLAGAWALGTGLSPAGRRLLASGLIGGALANGAVALAQVTVGLGRFGLSRYSGGQPLGLQGNPVFLGGIEAAALVLVAGRVLEGRRRVWLPVAVVALTIGATGERMSMLLAVVTAVAVPVIARVRSARGPGLAWQKATAFGGAVLAGVALGSVLPVLRGASIVARQASATAEGTFGDRLHAWLEGARYLVHHPLLGAGPGQFGAATSALFPLWFVRSHPGQVFTDGHDIVVEYAVTTGLLGLTCLVAFTLTALHARRGLLLGFAAAVAAVALIEPLNPSMTPLAFLAVGATSWSAQPVWLRRRARRHGTGATIATSGDAGSVAGEVSEPVHDRSALVGGPAAAAASPDRRAGAGVGPGAGRSPGLGAAAGEVVGSRWSRRVVAAGTVVAVLVAVAGATDLLAGTREMVLAKSDASLSHEHAALVEATLADHLLAPWPQAAAELAVVALLGRQANRRAPTPLAVATTWAQVAAARDPGDAPAWAAAGSMQLELGRLGPAAADAHVALRSYPWDAAALQLLGTIALDRDQPVAARRWFSLLVQVRPRPPVAVLMTGRCVGNLSGSPAAVRGPGCPGT